MPFFQTCCPRDGIETLESIDQTSDSSSTDTRIFAFQPHGQVQNLPNRVPSIVGFGGHAVSAYLYSFEVNISLNRAQGLLEF